MEPLGGKYAKSPRSLPIKLWVGVLFDHMLADLRIIPRSAAASFMADPEHAFKLACTLRVVPENGHFLIFKRKLALSSLNINVFEIRGGNHL